MATDTSAVIRVAIIEDQPRLRAMFAELLAFEAGIRMVGDFGDMESALEALAREPADVVLTDIGLPGLTGVEGVRRIKAMRPETLVLMLTVYDDNEHVFDAICAGASGYLLKDTSPGRLVDAIRELHAGGAPMSPAIARKVVAMFQRPGPAAPKAANLSPREIEVLRLLADGHSYKTAAATLDLSLDTVRFHIRHIYEKLHVHSKTEAVLEATRSRLIR